MNKIDVIDPVEVYNRISINRPYGKNFKPYNKEVLLYVIEYFTEIEDYEKCRDIKEYIDKRYNHYNNYI